MLFIPNQRATLLVPSGPSHDSGRKHLFVLLTNPHDDGRGVRHNLMAPLASYRPEKRHDPTCILHRGDHPFIRHDSYVAYRLMRLEPSDVILQQVKAGLLIPKEVMPEAAFRLICQGVACSGQTPVKLLRFYRAATGDSGIS